MGWSNEDGEHEGWMRPIAADGERGSGTSTGAGYYAEGYEYLQDRPGTIDPAFLRPWSGIVAWQTVCECGWEGQPVALADLPADEVDPRYNEPDEHRFHAEWKLHLRPFEATRELDLMADDLAALTLKIAQQVRYARADGASWSQIGRALGVSKQAAQQRYGG